jgi:hypothetical protein
MGCFALPYLRSQWNITQHYPAASSLWMNMDRSHFFRFWGTILPISRKTKAAFEDV